MSKYFLPTAILLSLFIYVDLLPMNWGTKEQDLPFFVQNDKEKQDIEEEDLAFFHCIQMAKKSFHLKELSQNDLDKLKIRSHDEKDRPTIGQLNLGDGRIISVIKFLGWRFINLHFGECTIKNLKECKEIGDQLCYVIDGIQMFNDNHKGQSPLLYSYADSKKLYKKLLSVLYRNDDNRDDRLSFLKRCKEKAGYYCKRHHKIDFYKNQIHEIRDRHYDGDCARQEQGSQTLRSFFLSLGKKTTHDLIEGEDISDQAIYDWKRNKSRQEIKMCEGCESGLHRMFEENDKLFKLTKELARSRKRKIKRLITKEESGLLKQI